MVERGLALGEGQPSIVSEVDAARNRTRDGQGNMEGWQFASQEGSDVATQAVQRRRFGTGDDEVFAYCAGVAREGESRLDDVIDVRVMKDVVAWADKQISARSYHRDELVEHAV